MFIDLARIEEETRRFVLKLFPEHYQTDRINRDYWKHRVPYPSLEQQLFITINNHGRAGSSVPGLKKKFS